MFGPPSHRHFSGEPDSDLPPSPPRLVRFSVFELDLEARELRKRGVKVRLPEQPFQVLELLLERHGQVVTRQELRERLWSTDTFVDFDLSLNSAVRKLREALSDSAERPAFVETVPRRGYRFIAPLEQLTAGGIAAPTLSARAAARRLLAVVALVAVAGAVVIWTVGWSTGSELAAVPPIRSIAVLPLDNLTGDPSRDYVVDGMTDALIAELSQLGSVAVTSRTSSMQYKGTKKRSPEIGRELNVDALVEGATALSGDTVHVTAQLIHAATDRHVWANRYERAAKDVLALQVEIARAIAAAIDNRIEPSLTSSSSHTQAVNPDAYDLYLKGKQAGGRLEYERLKAAVSYFEQAVARQPDFARAHASLAMARLQFLYVGPRSPSQVLPTVETAARRALALDDRLAEAHRALATSRRIYGDHSAAQAITERLMRLVSSAESHGLRVGGLRRARRFEEAVIEAERAQAADPLSVNAAHLLARTRRAAGDYTGALAEFQKALSLEPGRPNTLYELGATYVLKGDIRAAIPQFEKAIAGSSQRNPRFRAYLAYALAMVGRTEEARRILQELLKLREGQYVSLFGIAMIHDGLGEKDAALTALERAAQEHALEFIQLEQYPPFRTLAGEPRYRDLMERASAGS